MKSWLYFAVAVFVLSFNGHVRAEGKVVELTPANLTKQPHHFRIQTKQNENLTDFTIIVQAKKSESVPSLRAYLRVIAQKVPVVSCPLAPEKASAMDSAAALSFSISSQFLTESLLTIEIVEGNSANNDVYRLRLSDFRSSPSNP